MSDLACFGHCPCNKNRHFISRNKRTWREIKTLTQGVWGWWGGVEDRSQLAEPANLREEIFFFFPKITFPPALMQMCHCGHLLQCFPGNSQRRPSQLRESSPVMSLLLAGRESQDLRPLGGANHGRLCLQKNWSFGSERITKAICNSSQSTKHST